MNTSGNARDGKTFVLVKKDDREYHIYGTGKNREVFMVKDPAAKAADSTTTDAATTTDTTTGSTPTGSLVTSNPTLLLILPAARAGGMSARRPNN